MTRNPFDISDGTEKAPRTVINVGGADVQSMGAFVDHLADKEDARRTALGWAKMPKPMRESFKKQAFQLCFAGRFEQAQQVRSNEPVILKESK